jgi:hypothetical protein
MNAPAKTRCGARRGRLGLSIHLRGADAAPQEHSMKATGMIVLALGFAAMAATGAAAQSQETKTTTETKTEIKGGKDLKVTGCVERGTGTNYVLTGVRQDGGKGPTQYLLVTKDDLSKHVGHRVEIKGKAVTDGHGSVSVESKTKTEIGHAPDEETKTKTAATNGVVDVPFLSVTTIDSRSGSCN